MGIEIAKTGKLLYHLTKLSNLESIIQNGVLPRKTILEQGIAFGDVADEQIISKRKSLGLDKYTPFHFHPYSAFDIAVRRIYHSEDMIYLCIDRECARRNEFKVLPKHPLSEYECILYDYDEGISLIDWKTMMETNRTDDYAKQVKMAECLTDKRIPVERLTCIYVASQAVKDKVIEILERNDTKFPPPYVNIMDVWFRG